jgi:hypothetical protein
VSSLACASSAVAIFGPLLHRQGWHCSSLLIRTAELFVPYLEHFFGSRADTEATSLTLDAAVAIVDPLLNDPTCVEETRKFIDDLELNDPAFFEILNSNEDLFATLSADPPALPIAIQEVLGNPTAKVSKDGTGFTVYDDGRLKHMCLFCGKLYDRKPRADDCPNRDRELKPHECHGECGKENWYV